MQWLKVLNMVLSLANEIEYSAVLIGNISQFLTSSKFLKDDIFPFPSSSSSPLFEVVFESWRIVFPLQDDSCPLISIILKSFAPQGSSSQSLEILLPAVILTFTRDKINAIISYAQNRRETLHTEDIFSNLNKMSSERMSFNGSSCTLLWLVYFTSWPCPCPCLIPAPKLCPRICSCSFSPNLREPPLRESVSYALVLHSNVRIVWYAHSTLGTEVDPGLTASDWTGAASDLDEGAVPVPVPESDTFKLWVLPSPTPYNPNSIPKGLTLALYIPIPVLTLWFPIIPDPVPDPSPWPPI